jgi:hypothetical protein
MHKNATKCNETLSKWCKNKHGASKIIDTFETYQSAREIWTKLEQKYDVSKIIEDDCSPSTSGRDELSSTSLTCSKTQGNDMVSGDNFFNVDSELTFDSHSSLSHCNASSLDLDTLSTKSTLHACVDSPCT